MLGMTASPGLRRSFASHPRGNVSPPVAGYVRSSELF
jgi:hypothetical protein